MKTSLDHLPARQRNQLAAVVHEIRSAAEVEMVVLFGSRARGDWVEDTKGGYVSDFDILVIVERASMVDEHDLWSAVGQRAERHTARRRPEGTWHPSSRIEGPRARRPPFFSWSRKRSIFLIYSWGFLSVAPSGRNGAHCALAEPNDESSSVINNSGTIEPAACRCRQVCGIPGSTVEPAAS